MNSMIPRRSLGQGLQVSAIGLGCMGMSDFYGDSDQVQNLAVLHHALDIGVNFLDTADMYGVGRNELLLAEVLKTRRAEVVLATKFGNVRAPDGAFLGVCGTPEYVAQSCDASLARLGVDVIDLYYQHRIDPKVPIEDTVGAMQRLVEPARCAISACLKPTAPACAAPPRWRLSRAAKRVLAVDTRDRAGRAARLSRSRHRAGAVQSARPRLPHRRHPARRTICRPTTGDA